MHIPQLVQTVLLTHTYTIASLQSILTAPLRNTCIVDHLQIWTLHYRPEHSHCLPLTDLNTSLQTWTHTLFTTHRLERLHSLPLTNLNTCIVYHLQTCTLHYRPEHPHCLPLTDLNTCIVWQLYRLEHLHSLPLTNLNTCIVYHMQTRPGRTVILPCIHPVFRSCDRTSSVTQL